MLSLITGSHGEVHWDAVAILVFALVFLVVGVSRISEFNGVGLGDTTRKIFIAAHILGCFLFSIALGLLGVDVARIHRTLMSVVFFSGVGLLFPIHIYVGLKRRIRLKDLGNSPRI